MKKYAGLCYNIFMGRGMKNLERQVLVLIYSGGVGMPAVYGIDLIAKRDKKIKMDRSIIKGWNVHYQTLEEVEEASRVKKEKEEEEERKIKRQKERMHAEERLHTEDENLYTEDDEEHLKEAYNEKTGAYSGNYGRKPVRDEGQKQQIHAILNEKPEPFEYAMSTLAAQENETE